MQTIILVKCAAAALLLLYANYELSECHSSTALSHGDLRVSERAL